MAAKKNIVNEDSPLTPLQERFCQEYVKDLNATKAAIRAGYKETSAKSQASENLSKPNLQKFIHSLKEKRAKRSEVTADWVLTQLQMIAGVDIGELFNKAGGVKSIHEIPKRVRKAMSGIETVEIFSWGEHVGNTKKVKMNDKVKALELLGRHLNMWNDKQEAPPPPALTFKIGWGDDEPDRVDSPQENAATKKDQPE